MQPLKDMLPDFYRRRAGGDEVEQEIVLSCWASAVGPEIARHTQPIRLAGGTLVVDVATEGWRVQLRGLSLRIASRLNETVGKKAVEKVVFRLGLPGKIPPRRAATVQGGIDPIDEAQAIADPNLRRIYRQSRGARQRPKK
jgi:predicted nucleic acid-binding Zn ribbon protein